MNLIDTAHFIGATLMKRRVWKIQLFHDGKLYPNSPHTFFSEEEMLNQLGPKGWEDYLTGKMGDNKWEAYYGEIDEEV